MPAHEDDHDNPTAEAPGRTSRGIQSVEVGGQLLKALARSGRRMALKDLARDADMTPAKAHPYLVSFGKLGLIEQDPVSGHYGLGQLAVQLGLISLQQVDPVRLAIAELPALALTMGCTVSAAVFSSTTSISPNSRRQAARTCWRRSSRPSQTCASSGGCASGEPRVVMVPSRP